MGIGILRSSHISRLSGTACALAIAVALTGCGKTGQIATASIPAPSKPIASMNARELARVEARYADAYKANPTDKTIGINYATLLRMVGRDEQALAVMQQMAIHHPRDRDVLASYGKAQASAGKLEQALETVRRAQTPDRPDWRLLSAEAAILDQLGQSGRARQLYIQALDIAPNEPSVLSNLGMSHVLSGDLAKAEEYLRRAADTPGADSRVRQNLALVVGLQGRFEEAETIARAELPDEQAEANTTYLRAMLTQRNAWAKLRDSEG